MADFWADIILHSNRKGAFKRLDIVREIKTKHVVEIDFWVKEVLSSK
jgi:hypothetical protein